MNDILSNIERSAFSARVEHEKLLMRAEAAERAAKTEQEDAAREREAKAVWRKRAEAAEAALAKMTGERDRCCEDYQREAARAEKAEDALMRWDAQAIGEALGLPIGTDVPTHAVEAIKALRERDEAAEAEVARLKEELRAAGRAYDDLKTALAKKPPEPYTPRVGDVVTPSGDGCYGGAEWLITAAPDAYGHYGFLWLKASNSGWKYGGKDCTGASVRYLRPATPAERAAAGLPVEPATPEVLPEHLAWIEAQAAHYAEGYNHPVNGIEPRMVAARALVAAVARRDGGGK